MDETSNRGLVEQVYSRLSKGEIDAACELLTDDTKWHVPGLGIEAAGREEVTGFIKDLYGRGFEQKVLYIADHDDSVATWMAIVLPDGSHVRTCAIHRMENNKIAEYTSVRL